MCCAGIFWPCCACVKSVLHMHCSFSLAGFALRVRLGLPPASSYWFAGVAMDLLSTSLPANHQQRCSRESMLQAPLGNNFTLTTSISSISLFSLSLFSLSLFVFGSFLLQSTICLFLQNHEMQISVSSVFRFYGPPF